MIKKTINVLGLCALLSFSSCFDTIEEFTVNADGTGSYTVTMDMFKMVEMMMSMGGEEKMKSDPEYNEVKDSTFFFKDIIQEVPDLTEEEKVLFRDARFDMHMAMKEKAMNFKFTFPVTKYGDFNAIYQNSMKASSAMEKKLKSEKEEEASSEVSEVVQHPGDASSSHGPKTAQSPKPAGGNSMMPKKGGNDFMKSAEMYNLEIRDGFFSKQVIKEKFKAAMEKDSSVQMMKPMLKDANISTIVHFPRPVKKVDSDRATLSGDRKTVTLKISMSDYLEHPEYMNFKVEY